MEGGPATPPWTCRGLRGSIRPLRHKVEPGIQTNLRHKARFYGPQPTSNPKALHKWRFGQPCAPSSSSHRRHRRSSSGPVSEERGPSRAPIFAHRNCLLTPPSFPNARRPGPGAAQQPEPDGGAECAVLAHKLSTENGCCGGTAVCRPGGVEYRAGRGGRRAARSRRPQRSNTANRGCHHGG